jgi:hypothetical protein
MQKSSKRETVFQTFHIFGFDLQRAVILSVDNSTIKSVLKTTPAIESILWVYM